jgi:formylglycine-generating enzyme
MSDIERTSPVNFARYAGLILPVVLATACSGATEAPKPGPGDVPASTPPETPIASATPIVATTTTGDAAISVTATAKPEAPPSFQGKCAPGMAEFPGGRFKSSYFRTELDVAPFCLDNNLITTDEYTTCITSGKCDKTAVHACDPSTYNIPDRGKLPMICVDFMQSERYCKAQGKRLVSDLEWEWAARGGEAANEFPWGADAPLEQLCWGGKEKRTMPCPVASYPAGPKGVFDLVGNINQWTTTPNDATGSYRVGRGGSWKDNKPDQVKITARGGFKNTYRCGFLGIRCATAVP